MPINPGSSQVVIEENESSNYSIFSYIVASITGVILGVILIMLCIVIFFIGLKLVVFVFLVLPLSLLTGSDVSLVEFVFG